MVQHPSQPSLCHCPMARGTERGAVSLRRGPPRRVAGQHDSPASSSASSLPRLCLLTELNLQFHGLVTMSSVYKIHELLGCVAGGGGTGENNTLGMLLARAGVGTNLNWADSFGDGVGLRDGVST